MDLDSQTSLDFINQTLRYALNELRAIDGGEELPDDIENLAIRLRTLAAWIQDGRVCPDANNIIRQASNEPIQS